MIKNKLETFMMKRRCTLLGVGPMSVNCVDATIELANEHEVPIMMIASRRQIDAEEFGGGYVNNWSTEKFSDYVIDNDKKGFVILARDHGGPWQNTVEKEQHLSFRRAMESAKTSYKCDIDSGFEIIHIDPSEDIFGRPGVDEILNRVYELLEFCHEIASDAGKKILFEVGTEEQSGSTNTTEELEYALDKIISYCANNKLPKPTFVVVQTGTKVMETRNVGSFDAPFRIANELPSEIQIPKMIEICDRYEVLMKEHNTDYLSDEALHWHPKFGIHAANVAPEFGVIETRSLINLLEQHGLGELVDEFLEIALASRKWEKWMLPDSTADDREKAIIAGHYVFPKPGVIEIKAKAQRAVGGIGIDDYLKTKVKTAIMRYLRNFRLLRV